MNNSSTQFQLLPLSNTFLFLAPFECEDPVRLGNETIDGGYVIPKSMLTLADALLSFGIGTSWKFEQHWSEFRPEVPIHSYDASTDVDTLPEHHRKMYQQFFRGPVVHFKNNIGLLNTENTVAFDTAIRKIGGRNIFIKMDIEGHEYEFIDTMIDYADSVIGLVAEFHYIEPKIHNTQRQRFIDTIQHLQKKYSIVHVHGNNFGPVAADNVPDTLEITFVRSDLCKKSNYRHEFYLNGFDWPNNPHSKDFYMYIDNI